jgi:hypothetical protein
MSGFVVYILERKRKSTKMMFLISLMGLIVSSTPSMLIHNITAGRRSSKKYITAFQIVTTGR